MRRIALLVMAALFVLSLPLAALAGQVQVGDNAPAFQVHSSKDEVLTLDALAGKTAVIFYEDKDVAPNTTAAKDAIDEIMKAHPGRIVKVTILDGTPANWLTKPFWKDKLGKKSIEYGVTLWADWEGAMIPAYGMAEKDSNVIVIDPKGKVAFVQMGNVLDSFKVDAATAAIKKCAGQ